MNREQWLEERKKGLGGSDAAAALGLSKWKTPLQLYLEKRGEAPPVEMTEPMRWGAMLEPVVIQRYQEITGLAVERKPFEILRSREHPFMFLTPDGIAPGRGVEAKTARTREGWGEPGTDQVPQEYVIQVQHAMIVMVLPVFDIPVLFGGAEFERYEVPADRELQEIIVEGEHEFWNRVKKGDPPAPVNLEDVSRRYGRRSVANSVQADEHIIAAVEALHQVRAQLKEGGEREEILKVALMNFLGENETLMHGAKVLATWKMDKGRAGYTVEAKEPSRKFLLK